jgi:hypothetical protein
MNALVVAVSALVLLSLPSASHAQSHAVVTMVTVKVKGDSSAYFEKLRAVKPMVLRQGASSYRVFRADLAGEAAGTIVSIAEYGDIETFAKARATRATDKEYQQWYKDLISSNTSELVSISLLEEVSP